MKIQRPAMYVGLLATAIGMAAVTLAAREGQGNSSNRRERREDRQVFVRPGDSPVIRLDGSASRIGVVVNDPSTASDSGVAVDRVEADGAAARAGVQAGDRVVEFDGERVRSARQLTRLVQETPSGRTVKITVLRGSDRRSFDITPEADAATAFDERLGSRIEREIERNLPFFDFRTEGGFPSVGARARLGVRTQPLDGQLAEYFGAGSGGVLVTSVTAGSPAATAGLKAGDVITKVNGSAVQDTGDVLDAVSDVPDAGTVTLDIVRDRKPSTVTATLTDTRRRSSRRSTRPA